MAAGAEPRADCERQSQLLAFDGIADAGAGYGLRRPTRQGSARVLEPYQPFGENLRRNYLTPGRSVLTVIMAALAIAGLYFFKEHHFAVDTSLDSIGSRAQCMEYCELSKKDADVQEMVGGRGVCQEDVVFKVCRRTDLSKPTEKVCKTITEDDPEGNKPGQTICSFSITLPVWKPVLAMVLLATTIILIIQGLPSEVLLLGCACFFALCGVVTRNDVFNSFSDKGLTQVALLFPISAAIQETGLLEKAVGVLLGTPRSLAEAVPRMMIPVALLSAFLSNTATVAMLIPILCTWGNRLQVHPGKLLMPLSFASQLGGSCTLLGSSHVMIAKTAIANGRVYDMGFFDLAPVGVLLCGALMAVIAVLGRTSLLSSSAAKASDPNTEGSSDGEPEVYRLPVTVLQHGGMAGCSVQDSGLARVPGVRSVARQDGGDASTMLLEGDELVLHCEVKGVINVRALAGVRLKSADYLDLLGARRRQRFLYEVCVDSDSELLTGGLLEDPHRLRTEFGACLVAGPKARAGLTDPRVGPSSVLLLEADHRWVEDFAEHRWCQAFSLIQKVPNSSPLRTGLFTDKVRGGATCAGFLLIIALYTFKLVAFDVAAVVYLVILLVIRQLSLRELLGAMKVDIIFTIAGALAMGQALTRNGIVTFMSAVLLEVAGSSYLAVLAMVYLVAVFMSMFINNSATIGMLGPLVLEVVERNPSFSVKGLTWTLVFAAGSCFTTPLGYQTNLMVMPDGEYSFGDFLRFGAIVQACHFALTVMFVYAFCGLLPPDLPNISQ